MYIMYKSLFKDIFTYIYKKTLMKDLYVIYFTYQRGVSEAEADSPIWHRTRAGYTWTWNIDTNSAFIPLGALSYQRPRCADFWLWEEAGEYAESTEKAARPGY